MAVQDEEIVVRDTEARGASKEGVGRWVLIFGILIAVVLLAVVLMFGIGSQDTVEEEATVSGRIQSVDPTGSDNDGVLLGDDRGAADLGATPNTASDPAETVPNPQ